MNANVIFQISTVILALALAAVLIVVYVIPDEHLYSYPDVNDGLIEVDSFDIVDEYSGSSTTGKIFAIDDGEFKARLVADINVVDGDWGGFGINAYDHLVVDSIYCEFNGSIDHGDQLAGYVMYFYSPYVSHGRGETTISIDSKRPSVNPTNKYAPGSGTLVVDFKFDPSVSINELDSAEIVVGIGSRTTPEGYERLWPTYQSFMIPTKAYENG